IYDSTNVDVKESGLSYVFIHELTKILTLDGAKAHRLVTFNYDPLSADIEIRSAKIYRKDGSVEILSPDKFYDYPAPARAIYWGARDKAVDFGRLEPGDAIETVIFRKGFTYALLLDEDDNKFIPPMKGHFYDIIEFWSSVPIIEKVYSVAMPMDKPLQYEIYNGELKSFIHFPPQYDHQSVVQVNPYGAVDKKFSFQHEFPTVPNKVLYRWSKKNIEPFEREPNMVAPSDVATKLLLSTSPDWYAKSLWFYNVNEDFGSFDVTPEVQKKVDELLTGVTDEMEKISILTHWSAEEIRYSGISMGEGEGYTLHPGEMTFRDRCGVCKDKAGMLITMLRAAGFESYPAMTMAGSRIDKIPADQFNHSVTIAKLSNGDWILLDPTWVPGVREWWSSAEQQQQYLMGIPGGADIMTTPVSPAENHYWKLRGSSKLNERGTLEGSFTLEAEGQSDSGVRRAFTRRFISGWEEFIPATFAQISHEAEILEKQIHDPTDLSKPMSIYIKYRIPNYALITDGKIIFTPLLAKNPFTDRSNSGELNMDTGLEKRKYGFRTRCSKLVEIEETIDLPQFSEALHIPEFGKIDGESAKFKGEYSLSGSRLNVKATHIMEKRIYEAEDWPEFRSALMERINFMNSSIILAK
ncbi:DUF3857 domain-containing transglutaminase family protein, partial [Bacteroidota bacterium]